MQTLKNHEFTRAGRPGYGKDFWDELLGGDIKRLKRGTDFQAAMKSMVTLIYATARKRGLNVRIESDRAKQILTVQAYNLPKKRNSKKAKAK